MASATVVGSTGLVGSHLVGLLIDAVGFSKLSVFSRNPLAAAVAGSAKVESIVDKDSESWPNRVKPTDVFFSGLGTTRAAAGGFAEQVKIDYDLNLALAKAAKKSNARVYVLVSAANANTKSMFGYSQMKGNLERDVAEIGFDHTVILQPGLIMGDRSVLGQQSRYMESMAMAVMRAAGTVMSKISPSTTLYNPADSIAAAAIRAVELCQSGNRPDKNQSGVWLVGPSEIAGLSAQYYSARKESLSWLADQGSPRPAKEAELHGNGDEKGEL